MSWPYAWLPVGVVVYLGRVLQLRCQDGGEFLRRCRLVDHLAIATVLVVAWPFTLFVLLRDWWLDRRERRAWERPGASALLLVLLAAPVFAIGEGETTGSFHSYALEPGTMTVRNVEVYEVPLSSFEVEHHPDFGCRTITGVGLWCKRTEHPRLTDDAYCWRWRDVSRPEDHMYGWKYQRVACGRFVRVTIEFDPEEVAVLPLSLREEIVRGRQPEDIVAALSRAVHLARIALDGPVIHERIS